MTYEEGKKSITGNIHMTESADNGEDDKTFYHTYRNFMFSTPYFYSKK